MVQIKCLSNGLYSLKNSHIPFGMGFQPPPPYGGFPFEQHFSYYGAPLKVFYRRSKKDLGLNSKNPYKGKIQAFGAKLGLFWDHFWTFLGLCRHFHEMEKTCKKPRSRDISQFKIYLTVSRYQRAREYQRRLADKFPPDKCPCGQVPFWTISPRTSSPLDNFPPDKFPWQASI